MFAVRPVILLTNTPVPVPFVVWLPVTKGLGVEAQQTPRAVIAAPPSLVILPPLNAVVLVMELVEEVIMVGKSDSGALNSF